MALLKMEPDIYIKVRFKTSFEGGRKTPVKRKSPFGVDYYACPLIVDDNAYDCRILIGDNEIELGKYYELPVKFLNIDLALPSLSSGKKITLWEGKEVAKGEILRIEKK